MSQAALAAEADSARRKLPPTKVPLRLKTPSPGRVTEIVTENVRDGTVLFVCFAAQEGFLLLL